MVDFSIFDWENIFGVVESVSTCSRNQLRPLSAEIIEKSISKYSGGQLQYMGDCVNGYDFCDTEGIRYECKSKKGMFQKKSFFTKEIIVKNYFGLMTDNIPQTFDQMILMDTTQNSVGIISHQTAVKCARITNSSITTRIPLTDVKYVARNVTPTKKPNFENILNNFISQAI